MDSEELANLGQKARRETEAYINRHLHDHTQRWPLTERSGMIRQSRIEPQESSKPRRIEFMIG